MKTKLFVALLSIAFACSIHAEEHPKANVKIDVDKPGIKVAKDLYGIFFEEINLAGDGGIYPELIRNRSFEFSKEKPDFWTFGAKNGAIGNMSLEKHDSGTEYNSAVLRLEGTSGISAINEGYWGIPIEKDKSYNVVIRAKADGDFAENGLQCQIESANGKSVLGVTKTGKIGTNWKTFRFQLKFITDEPKARFTVLPAGKKGTIWLDYVSLKPVDTYKGNGLRKDLMEKLAAMKPAFVRFPGGCWVEGDTMKEASRWKRTIGDTFERWTQPNIWGYMSTNGLGFHEYLQMCEDLGASAMFVINCGMSHKENVPMDKMGEFIQDAMDAIEYANGPADSKWGKIRADNGHPEPFNMKYIQIGNENGGPVYWERYDAFYTKIREKYPNMQIVACKWGGKITNKMPIEIYDEHYYKDPQFFANNAFQYDSYKRGEGEMKIYVGEYAVTQKCGQGNLDAAVGEAAFMTGMERNSDVVTLSSYAPLFVNVNHRKWNPDLICFDGTRSYGIPSYHVQTMFSNNRSDVIVPSDVQMPLDKIGVAGAVGVGTWETNAEFKDAKIVKDGVTLYESKLDKALTSAKKGTGDWRFVDGVLRQTSNREDCMYSFGDENWDDYVYTVKAKKNSGKEGFFVYFNVKDGYWGRVNLGGWQNSYSQMQFDSETPSNVRSNFVVETDRWYDIKIEVKGESIKCFVDDKLILADKQPPRTPTGIYVVSGLNEKKDELIIKAVNTKTLPCETTFSLGGVAKLGNSVKEIVLTSENGLDENTLDNPDKISPKESTFSIDSTTFSKSLPGKSVSVFRIGIK